MKIHTLDLHFQGCPGVIASYLIESEGSLALIETGPGSTLPTLLEEIRKCGFDPAAVKKVFVTHIHLDHAGAAGWWAQQGAEIFVHARGAPHLIDPAKLIESAQRIYGDRMDTLWGPMLAAPAERVKVLGDGDKVRIGKAEIIALDTPGHARHHLAFVVGTSCFTGDVAGMRLRGSSYISVTAAPPQFDPVAYSESLARLESLHFSSLYLTHFGEIQDVSKHLASYALRMEQVHEKVADWTAQGRHEEAIRNLFTESEHATAMEDRVSQVDWDRYELANPTSMCADGISLFVKKNR